jgi:hypothetical protein
VELSAATLADRAWYQWRRGLITTRELCSDLAYLAQWVSDDVSAYIMRTLDAGTLTVA